jgi:hypothetical protein
MRVTYHVISEWRRVVGWEGGGDDRSLFKALIPHFEERFKKNSVSQNPGYSKYEFPLRLALKCSVILISPANCRLHNATRVFEQYNNTYWMDCILIITNYMNRYTYFAKRTFHYFEIITDKLDFQLHHPDFYGMW